MREVFQIAKFFNIPVRIHWTFGLLLAWIGYSGWEDGAEAEALVWLYALVFTLFICVVLHEFGHALAARRYGIGTRDITLSPIGGIARLHQIPEKPIQELVVAIAGPAVNVLIAVGLSLTLAVVLSFQPDRLMDILRDAAQGSDYLLRSHLIAAFLLQLIVANLMLVVFNLIPAFPMDGGRVLRAILSIYLHRLRATLIAARLGQFLAICFFVFGIWSRQYVTGLIGVFVFFAAAFEYKMVKQQHQTNETEPEPPTT